MTPSPESNTIPVVRPDAYLARTRSAAEFETEAMKCLQRKDSLNRCVHGRHVKSLEKNLGGLFSI